MGGSQKEGVIFPSERGGNLLQKEGVPRKGRCSLRKKGKGVPILEETMPHGNSLGHIMYGLYDIHDTHIYICKHSTFSLSISISKCAPATFCRRGVVGKEEVVIFT